MPSELYRTTGFRRGTAAAGVADTMATDPVTVNAAAEAARRRDVLRLLNSVISHLCAELAGCIRQPSTLTSKYMPVNDRSAD
jgi:hypothetical protein